MSEIENSEATGLSEAILKSMPEALIFSDLEGIIRFWNPGAQTVFGFSAAEAVGQSLDRRFRALRFLDYFYDLRQHRFGANAIGAKHKIPLFVNR